jgi:hypothetical protein
MPTLGTTLRCNLPPRHIWIVLTDPACTGGEILLVNFTSVTEECVDELAARGTLLPETAQIFRNDRGEPFHLYQHQV